MSLRNFDGLLSMLDQLQKEDVLASTESLQVHLRFLRMIFRWANSSINKGGWVRSKVLEVETYVAHTYLKMQQYFEEGDYGEMSKAVADLLAKIERAREILVWFCESYMNAGHSCASFGTLPDAELVLKQLLDPLQGNINHIISSQGVNPLQAVAAPALCKEPLQRLQDKLTFVRNCLVSSTTRERLFRYKRSKDLMNMIGLVCENALFLCALCWWGEHEESRMESLAKDALYKIQDNIPFFVLAYSKDMRATLLEGPRDTGFEALMCVHYLHTYLKDLINPGTRSALFRVGRYHIQAVLKELWFLEDFLMHTIPHPTESHVLKLELTQMRSLADEVRSAIPFISRRKLAENNKLKNVISDLLNCIDTAKAEIRLHFIPENCSCQFPRALNLCFVDTLLQNLEELLCNGANLIASVKSETETLFIELKMMRPFIGNALEDAEVEGLKQLMERLAYMLYKAEFHVDSITVNNGPKWSHMVWLSDVVEEIKLLRSEATRIWSMMTDEEKVVGLDESFTTLSLEVEEDVVGYDDELQRMQDRLERGRKLDIIPIIGMPGLGKTTVARKLYKSRSVTSHFPLRLWCCVSQVHTRRRLLLDLLHNIIELDDRKMTDDDLAELLCRKLKGGTYLIVLDDIWSLNAWTDLCFCFPDHENGSRILLTSRSELVSLQIRHDCAPMHLRSFSNEESLQLLGKRVFGGGSFPPELSIIGKDIAEHCRGLPLAVVVVAGILKVGEQTVRRWNSVAESVRKHTFDESRRIMQVLELSYQQLPHDLKPCFLYFGGFPQDREISVQKIVKLWIAEGLVLKVEGKNSVDVAEVYVKDLVGRSLVMVAKRRKNGGIKACRLHDLLLQFCLEKAKEENFLSISHGDRLEDDLRILCIHAQPQDIINWRPYNYPHARSLLFNGTARFSRIPHDFPFLMHSTKLLRVLDLTLFILESFPLDIELLVHLAYLAVRGEMNDVPSSIEKLRKLETLLVKGLRGAVLVPGCIWNMKRLKHLQICDRADFTYHGDDTTFSSADIESFATPSLFFGDDSMLHKLARFPCLRKLRCIFYGGWDISMGCNRFPALDFLSKLESLIVFYYGMVQYPCGGLNFPQNLKKLTLSKFRLPWSHISTIGEMPNLEVLKLLFKSFEGDTWDVNDQEFPSLKYLKLEALDIVQWNLSMCTDPFPSLEHLVLQRCKDLESIPSEIGYVSTLQKIEVRFCNRAAAESARSVQEEQLEMGNTDLQVHIHPSGTGFGPIPQPQVHGINSPGSSTIAQVTTHQESFSSPRFMEC